MKVKVHWDKKLGQHALFFSFEPNWDWKDFLAASREAIVYMQAVRHDVDLILDLRGCIDLPIGTASALREMLNNAPINFGEIVVIGDEYIRVSFTMLKRFDNELGSMIYVEDTEDKARRAVINHLPDYVAIAQ